LAEEYEGQVTFFGVSNNDTVEAGREYADEYDVPYELAHAPDVWDAFGVPYQPVTIVIDENGGIAHRVEGEVSYEMLKGLIEQEV
jgi:peroxiredoxin